MDFVNGWLAVCVLQRKLELEQEAGGWEAQEKMFLVCVYNVSPDQPYTVFKAPCSSTALDITQVRRSMVVSVLPSVCVRHLISPPPLWW